MAWVNLHTDILNEFAAAAKLRTVQSTVANLLEPETVHGFSFEQRTSCGVLRPACWQCGDAFYGRRDQNYCTARCRNHAKDARRNRA